VKINFVTRVHRYGRCRTQGIVCGNLFGSYGLNSFCQVNEKPRTERRVEEASRLEDGLMQLNGGACALPFGYSALSFVEREDIS